VARKYHPRTVKRMGGVADRISGAGLWLVTSDSRVRFSRDRVGSFVDVCSEGNDSRCAGPTEKIRQLGRGLHGRFGSQRPSQGWGPLRTETTKSRRIRS